MIVQFNLRTYSVINSKVYLQFKIIFNSSTKYLFGEECCVSIRSMSKLKRIVRYHRFVIPTSLLRVLETDNASNSHDC